MEGAKGIVRGNGVRAEGGGSEVRQGCWSPCEGFRLFSERNGEASEGLKLGLACQYDSHFKALPLPILLRVLLWGEA